MTSKRPEAPREANPGVNAREDGTSLSFGSALGDIDFQPLGRRSVRAGDVGPDLKVSGRRPSARSVSYDHQSSMIVVEFANGSTFMIPASAFESLSGATDDEIADVELLGETLLYWKSRDTAHDIAAVLGGDFRPISSLEKPPVQAAMETIEGGLASVPLWVDPVIRLLSNNLPGDSKVRWYHDFLTAYQIGCETLVALGQAEITEDGAIPRVNPALPPALPRQDDVAVAVICLAAQNGLIVFFSKGGEEPGRLTDKGYDGLHRSGDGSWAAGSHPDVTDILRLLGLLDGREWTDAAETVLWRESPPEWRIDFTNHPRFLDAVDEACAEIPDHVRDAVDRFSHVTDDDIAIYTATPDKSEENPNSVMRLPPQTREQAISTVLWIRRFDFDELFYKFWRIEDGWLDPDEAARALEIFNDPLAIAMRKAVAARLYPHLAHSSADGQG